jgi:hypothetical protein
MVVGSRFRAYLDIVVPRSTGVPAPQTQAAEPMSETDPTPQREIKSDPDWKRQVRQEAAELDAKQQVATRAETDSGKSDAGKAGPGASEHSAEHSAEHAAAYAAAADESSASTASAGQLPPADFTMLVSMFATQAMVALGVIPNPESGKPEQNLLLARHFIDLLGVLQEKTRRNLTGHEADLLTNSLHELRLAYVEFSKSASAPPSPRTERTDTPT